MNYFRFLFEFNCFAKENILVMTVIMITITQIEFRFLSHSQQHDLTILLTTDVN